MAHNFLFVKHNSCWFRTFKSLSLNLNSTNLHKFKNYICIVLVILKFIKNETINKAMPPTRNFFAFGVLLMRMGVLADSKQNNGIQQLQTHSQPLLALPPLGTERQRSQGTACPYSHLYPSCCAHSSPKTGLFRHLFVVIVVTMDD